VAPRNSTELTIERGANRAICRVAHWVVPSASARSARAAFLAGIEGLWPDPLDQPLKTKIWGEALRRGTNLGAAARRGVELGARTRFPRITSRSLAHAATVR